MNLCPVWMAASERKDPHPRVTSHDEETGSPVICMDYELLEEHITALVVKDEQSEVTLA